MRTTGSSEYQRQRELIYQSLPHLREQMQWLDYTLARLSQLKGEDLDVALSNLTEQQILRSVGSD